jgi:hypothetical protein
MELSLFKTAWGAEGTLTDWVQQCRDAGFAGLEAPAPLDAAERAAFFDTLAASGLAWIAEVSTCTPTGLYVPTPHGSVAQHLASLEAGVVRSLEGGARGAPPLFVNTMAGSDSWSAAEAVEFHRGVVVLQEQHETVISVETHRGRSTYSPWLTRDILRAVPQLRITCDFSHWCVVAERLVLDEEAELLELAARAAHHIQPRVGYNQGPQVPDPRAPEFDAALAAHERWWDVVWGSMAARGVTRFTMTPEFGPDGYLQCAPFTRAPVANLWTVNTWIGHRQRERFNQRFGAKVARSQARRSTLACVPRARALHTV